MEIRQSIDLQPVNPLTHRSGSVSCQSAVDLFYLNQLDTMSPPVHLIHRLSFNAEYKL